MEIAIELDFSIGVTKSTTTETPVDEKAIEQNKQFCAALLPLHEGNFYYVKYSLQLLILIPRGTVLAFVSLNSNKIRNHP